VFLRVRRRCAEVALAPCAEPPSRRSYCRRAVQSDARDGLPSRGLSHSRFEEVDFSQSRFHHVYFQDTVIRGAWLKRVKIDGYLDEVTINGVDVGPLIAAELDRGDPDRRLVRPTDADGLRRAWQVVVRRWVATVHRAPGHSARTCCTRPSTRVVLHRDPATSHLRHRRLGATGRAGRPDAYHPLGLAHSETPATVRAVVAAASSGGDVMRWNMGARV
jgi:hypothetical protein